MLFLAGVSCNRSLLALVQLIKTIVTYITILVPIILVVIGTFDLLKAVTASKEDEIKSAQKLLIKRVIYAILIFLLVPILSIIFNLFDKKNVEEDLHATYDGTWINYWNKTCDIITD